MFDEVRADSWKPPKPPWLLKSPIMFPDLLQFYSSAVLSMGFTIMGMGMVTEQWLLGELPPRILRENCKPLLITQYINNTVVMTSLSAINIRHSVLPITSSMSCKHTITPCVSRLASLPTELSSTTMCPLVLSWLPSSTLMSDVCCSLTCTRPGELTRGLFMQWLLGELPPWARRDYYTQSITNLEELCCLPSTNISMFPATRLL